MLLCVFLGCQDIVKYTDTHFKKQKCDFDEEYEKV